MNAEELNLKNKPSISRGRFVPLFVLAIVAMIAYFCIERDARPRMDQIQMEAAKASLKSPGLSPKEVVVEDGNRVASGEAVPPATKQEAVDVAAVEKLIDELVEEAGAIAKNPKSSVVGPQLGVVLAKGRSNAQLIANMSIEDQSSLAESARGAKDKLISIQKDLESKEGVSDAVKGVLKEIGGLLDSMAKS